VKRLTAILFSLLLIVAQTFAVVTPVSGKPAVMKSNCCGDVCCCSVNQPSAPSVPLTEPTAPTVAQNQFVFPPSAFVAFLLAVPVSNLSPAPAAADLHAAAPPLFRRNCSLLI